MTAVELTDDVIQLTYFLAVKLVGRRRWIDPKDVAHEAFLRIDRRTKPVPHKHLSRYVMFVLRSVVRDQYSPDSMLKVNVLLFAEPLTDDGVAVEPDDVTAAVDLGRVLLRRMNRLERSLVISLLYGHTHRQIAAADKVTMQCIRDRRRSLEKNYDEGKYDARMQYGSGCQCGA